MNRTKAGAIGAISFILLAPILAHQLNRGSVIQVTTLPTTERTVLDSVSATGSLTYEQEASLSPEVLGRVTEVTVKEGDLVARGQVVLRIEDAPLRASVEQQQAAITQQLATIKGQQATLATARKKLERIEPLEKSGIIAATTADDQRLQVSLAQTDLQRDFANLTQTRALLAQAVQQLSLTVIRSPIAGAVTTVGIKPGETAVPSATGIPGSSLVTIANLNTMVDDLDVNESDVSKLRKGQQADVYCPPLPNTALHGTVQFISLALRPERLGLQPQADGRSYSVKVAFDDSRLAGLRPGMECRATIYTSSAKPQLAVPIRALLSDNADDVDGFTRHASSGGQTGALFVVDHGYARRRSVTLGRSDNDYQQVLSGLSPGETIIVGPYKSLRVMVPGQRVEVIKSESDR